MVANLVLPRLPYIHVIRIYLTYTIAWVHAVFACLNHKFLYFIFHFRNGMEKNKTPKFKSTWNFAAFSNSKTKQIILLFDLISTKANKICSTSTRFFSFDTEHLNGKANNIRVFLFLIYCIVRKNENRFFLCDFSLLFK